MGITETIVPSGGVISSGLSNIGKYSWVLWFLVGFVAIIFIGVLIKMSVDKKRQWTHTLKIRRINGTDNSLSDPEYIRMKRFPLIKRAEIFELEKPLLGGYLIPEPAKYSKNNEYSIILDRSNRIWLNEGEFFIPAQSSCNISARHAGIDNSRADLRADFQNINKTTKRIEWAQIAKFAMIGLLIICSMIVIIKAIGAWSDSEEQRAKADASFANAMANLAEALKTSEATANTQLIIIDEIKKLKNTNNIQSVVRNLTNATV